jgi:hypothetical protein
MLVIWLGALFVLSGLLFMATQRSGEGGSVKRDEKSFGSTT